MYLASYADCWAVDNIDGKQARRAGTSSGLGELFDHGIDSLNCTLASLLETSAMALGATKLGAFTVLIPTLPMFFSTWETYHSHTLYLGYFNGPTEGLIVASTIMIISGVYGPQVWHLPLADHVGFSDTLGDLSVADVWIPFLLVAFFVGHLPSCIYHVVQARRAQNLQLASAFLGWTPMLIFTASLIAWLGSPYSNLLRDNHLYLLSLTMSVVFGRMTTKIILAHLTRQPFPYWTAMLAPLIGGAVLANLPYLGLEPVSAAVEYYYLCGYFVFAVIVYFRWAYLVINAICQYLKIPCLTIPEEKWKALQKEKRASTHNEINGAAKGGKGRRSQ